MCVVADLCAVDLRSSHQLEDEIGAASSENGLFIAKMEFSVRTGGNVTSLPYNITTSLPCIDFISLACLIDKVDPDWHAFVAPRFEFDDNLALSNEMPLSY